MLRLTRASCSVSIVVASCIAVSYARLVESWCWWHVLSCRSTRSSSISRQAKLWLVFYCCSTSPVICGIQSGTESDMDLFRSQVASAEVQNTWFPHDESDPQVDCDWQFWSLNRCLHMWEQAQSECAPILEEWITGIWWPSQQHLLLWVRLPWSSAHKLIVCENDKPWHHRPSNIRTL